MQDELAVRFDRLVERRNKAASLRDQKTLEDFDWDFNRSIRKKAIFDFAAGDYVRQHQDVLLLGRPGVGESHISQAIGHQLIRSGYTIYYRSIFDTARDMLHDDAFDGRERVMARYLKPDLLILDDMGMKQLPKRHFDYEMVFRHTSTRGFLQYLAREELVADIGRILEQSGTAS